MDARLKAQIEELIGLRPGAQQRRAVRWADLKNGIAGGAGFNAEAVRNIAEKVAREVAESYDSANIDFAQLQAEINAAMAEATAARSEVLSAISAANAAQAYADTIVAQARSDFQIDFDTAISASQDALAASQAAQLAAGGANEDRLAAEAAAQAALAQADLTVQERIASQTARSGAEVARDQAVVARDEAGAAQAAAQTSQTIAAEAANRALTGNIDADAGLTGFPANYTLSGATARLTKVTPTVEGAAQAEALRFGTTNNNVLAAFATPASPVERAANRTYRMSVRTLGQTSPGNVSNGVNGRFEVHIEALLAGAVVETHRLALNAPVSLTTWGLVDVAQAIAAEHDAVRWRFDRPTGRSADNLLIADRIIRDVTESASAANSANAAATSAALAASSATDAGSNAVASEQSRLAAEAAQAGAQTARANAEVARDAAVTARQDAQGAASTATTQAGLAATARDQAGNSASAAATSASAAETSATQAGQQASAAESSRLSAETARGGAETARTEAESARDGATIARDAAVVARQDAEGASAAAQTSANLAATSRNEAAGFADAAGTARTQAQNSATAAANSATTAGTSATNAGSSATAANNARIAAEAARDGANSASASAGVARDQAVLARQNAEGAAAAAQESLNLTAEVSGRDMSVINDTFLISSDWQRIGSQGTLTTPANTIYPIGRDWRFVVTNSQNDGLRINQSPATIWPGQTNAEAFVVEVEFTLVTGGLGGAGIQLAWTNSAGSNFWTWAALADIQAGAGLAGRARTARVVLRRPANFTGTFASHTLIIHANAQEQNWVRQAKTITFHRVRIRPATAEELGSGEVEAGVRANILVDYLTSASTQQAIAALREDMTVEMGGSLAAVRRSAQAIANLSGTVARFSQIASVNGEQVAAGIEAVSFNNEGGASGSVLKLIGDNVVAEGTLSANALVVGLGKNLLADPEFVEGSQHWTPGEWDAANHSLLVLAPGSFGAHPAFPTLAARQTGTSTANASVGYRPVSNESGARAWGVPVVAGQRYCASAYLRVTGGGVAEARMQIIWRDASGNVLGNNTPPFAATGGDGFLPDTWPRMAAFGLAPSGAVFAEIRAQKAPSGQFPNTLCIWKPQFEEVHAAASGPSPWAPGGTSYISGDRIVTGGVVSRHVTTDTIRAINGRFNSLSAANISVGNAEIGAAQIANAAITRAKIEDAAINSAKIQDLEVTRLKVANGAITSYERAFTAGSITASVNGFFSAQQLSYTIGRAGPQTLFIAWTATGAAGSGLLQNHGMRIIRTNAGNSSVIYTQGFDASPSGSDYNICITDTAVLSGPVIYGFEFSRFTDGTVSRSVTLSNRFFGALNVFK
ncbi:hypothetical protein [Paracoccus sp. NSM]|uniref:hypothetical protein n=1 Tax=Paracoccus sp. NSM TaxID=3457784 RepID=UPI0040360907